MALLKKVVVLLALVISSLAVAQSVPIPKDKATQKKVAVALATHPELKRPKEGRDYWLEPDKQTLVIQLPTSSDRKTIYCYLEISKKNAGEIGRDIFDNDGLVFGWEDLKRERTKTCSRLKNGNYLISITRTEMAPGGGSVTWYEVGTPQFWSRDRTKPPHP
jgi:hypothetical protein